MHIEHLEAHHFRNLDGPRLDLAPDAVVVRGDNAQGKTNLLEALYVCATGKSFRSASPGELLHHGTEAGWVRARFVRDGVRHDVEINITPRRRQVRVDGRGVRGSAKLLELVNVVAFFPDDLRIIKGSPEGRRKFLDRSVGNHRKDFVEASVAYQKALKSRNAILRSGREGSFIDRRLVEVYDEQLIEHGRIVHAGRQQTLQRLAPRAADLFRHIMATTATFDIGVELSPGLGSSYAEGMEFDEAFRMALAKVWNADRARGVTHVGPHRADLEISVAGQPAQKYASQGQQRSLVLAMKLAEVSYLRDHLGCAPILLLDDVSSELDPRRSQMLFDLVGSLDSQVWVSTTGAAPLPLPSGTQVFHVQSGLVAPAESAPNRRVGAS